MMTKAITLGEFSNAELEDFVNDKDEIIVDENACDGERSCIIVEPVYCCIPELGVKVANGVMSYWNESEKMWNGDFSMTLVYSIDEDDAQKYLYWEQDGAEITLWNWLRSTGKLDEERFKNLDDISNLNAFVA